MGALSLAHDGGSTLLRLLWLAPSPPRHDIASSRSSDSVGHGGTATNDKVGSTLVSGL